MNERVPLVTVAQSVGSRFHWVPDWSRTWRDRGFTDYRFRVVKWGWWYWTIRLRK